MLQPCVQASLYIYDLFFQFHYIITFSLKNWIACILFTYFVISVLCSDLEMAMSFMNMFFNLFDTH